MKVWKSAFHSILESFIFHAEISVPFHFIPRPGCRFYIIIATFYLNSCSQFQSLKIRKRLILKKLLLLLPHFQYFRFRVRFRFQPLPSKCFRFHKKLTVSAPSFRFHIPGCSNGPNNVVSVFAKSLI